MGDLEVGLTQSHGAPNPIIFPTHQTLVFMILFLEKKKMECERHEGLRGSRWLGLEFRVWSQG